MHGEGSFGTVSALNVAGCCCIDLDEFSEAAGYIEQAIEIEIAVKHDSSSNLHGMRTNLAGLYVKMGKVEQAKELLCSALADGGEHPNVAAIAHTELGFLHGNLGELDEAKAHHERARELNEVIYGPGHANAAGSLVNIGDICVQKGEYAEAAEYARQAVGDMEKVFPPEHPWIHNAHSLLRRASLRTIHNATAPQPTKTIMDLVTVIGKDSSKVEVSSLEGKIVGLYFSAHWCPPCRGFTPVLAEKYQTLIEDGAPFEIIFCSSDQDQSAFDEYYGSMPWLTLAYDERDAKETLSQQFDVQGIPSLVLLDGSSWETITTDGRDAILNCPFDKLRDYESDKAKAAAELDEKMKNAPAELSCEHHEHPLTKTTNTELGGPYGGGFRCDVCSGGGSRWVYHCAQCGWDAHPHCVGL